MTTGPNERLRVLPETADATLIARPLRTLEDVETIECVPLKERVRIVNFSERIDITLAAHDPNEP